MSLFKMRSILEMINESSLTLLGLKYTFKKLFETIPTKMVTILQWNVYIHYSQCFFGYRAVDIIDLYKGLSWR